MLDKNNIRGCRVDQMYKITQKQIPDDYCHSITTHTTHRTMLSRQAAGTCKCIANLVKLIYPKKTRQKIKQSLL